MLYKVSDLFDLTHTRAAELLEKCEYPHEVLPRIKPFILALGETLPISEFLHPSPTVWIARDAVVAPTACLGECIIIDHGAEVRHCAYIRGSALIGRDAVVGYRAHMGAGAVTSNVKGDRQPVVVHRGSERMETGLKKLGAMLGDYAEIGCGAVLNPGAVIGRGAQVYPLVSVRGTVPANCIHQGGSVVEKR